MTSSTQIPTLETNRLLLRGHELSDFPDSAAMWADPVVVKHISGVPTPPELAWARFLRYAGHWQHLGFGYWVVTSKADGTFLGEVGFADYHRDTTPSLKGKPEAGWVLATAAHGQGYATEAVAAILAWADDNLECSHTCAMFDPTHAASIHVARKLGFGGDVMGRYGDHEALFLERPRRGP
ncbi:MAG: GNAT family N-acetyltransferase [Paracoccaceae bacterium]